MEVLALDWSPALLAIVGHSCPPLKSQANWEAAWGYGNPAGARGATKGQWKQLERGQSVGGSVSLATSGSTTVTGRAKWDS